jgi:hypothetical protein
MPRKQIPLVGDEGLYIPGDPIRNDGLTSYPFYLNGYFEKGTVGLEDDRKVSYVKRPGLNNVFTNNIPGGLAGPYYIIGMISSIDRTNLFMFCSDGLNRRTFRITASTIFDKGVPPAAAGSWTATGPVCFTRLDGISYGAGNHACATDFTKGATIDSAGLWTEITDAVFTGLTKVTNFTALDGYLFIGTSNNRIYNCELNTPNTWKATSFLTAADTPGQIVALGRLRNFIVAFKQGSMEFFEDVGNPSPGSPLEPRRQYNRTIGCINPNTIQEMSDGIIFAGAANNGAPKMYKLRKDDLQVVEISNRYIQQCLAIMPVTTAYSPDTNGGTVTPFNGQSQAFSLGGKEFYLTNIQQPATTTLNRTAVYDNELGVWTSWATSFAANGVTDDHGFGGTMGQMFVGASGLTGVIFAVNLGSGTGSTGQPQNQLYFMDLAGIALNWNDECRDGVISHSFPFSWTSDILDFGSRRRKFMDSLEVIYESQNVVAPSLTNTSHPVSIYYKEYNQNLNSGYYVQRTGYVDPGNGARCVVKQMGSFFRRSFTIINSTNCALKIWGIEIDYNEGESDQDGG